jgi:hypothetical protein
VVVAGEGEDGDGVWVAGLFGIGLFVIVAAVKLEVDVVLLFEEFGDGSYGDTGIGAAAGVELVGGVLTVADNGEGDG